MNKSKEERKKETDVHLFRDGDFVFLTRDS